jgi:hypothetical protein
VSDVNLYPLDVNGGETHRLELPAPSKGEIKKAEVIQFTGAKDGFSFAFYNSAVGCPPGVNNDADVEPWQEAQAQVSGIRAAAAGSDRYMKDGADGAFSSAGVYRNADGSLTNMRSKLYMKLTVAGAGAKRFGIFLQIDPKGG